MDMLSSLRVVQGLQHVADAFSGTTLSDVIKMTAHGRIMFIVQRGVGATGTAVLTVQGCDNAAGDNPVAVPFRYRTVDLSDSDIPTALTVATAAGFTFAAGTGDLALVEVEDEVLSADGVTLTVDKGWVQLKSVEGVDSPVLGGIIAILGDPLFSEPTTTVIA